MLSVEYRNITKSFGNNKVLNDISLKVSPGEFLVLVGPSGCGKSTLLRILAGLEETTSGEVLIQGNVVNHIDPKDRDIAMVFQSYALYPHMSVFDNMAFGLKMKKIDQKEIEKRVEEAADILQLNHLLQRRPKELSGGQRQRVALGRALVRKAGVFLFDEPLSNLDAKLRNKMRIEIKKIHQMFNNTMIYVTHDQVEATTLGDRIALLNHGIIQQIDAPSKIYSNPVNKFVAGFIGAPEMNFIEGKALDELKKYIPALNDKKEVILGIRPEDLYLDKRKDHLVHVEAKYEMSEFLGAKNLHHFSIGGKMIGQLTHQVVTHPYGALVQIYFDLTSAHFFDSKTLEKI